MSDFFLKRILIMRCQMVFILTVRMYALALILFWGVSSAAIAQITKDIRVEQMNVLVGQPVLIKVYFHNEGNNSITFRFPDSLSLRIVDVTDSEQLVVANEVISCVDVRLDSGEFVSKEYRFILPDLPLGMLAVFFDDISRTVVLMNVSNHGLSKDSFVRMDSLSSDSHNKYSSLDSISSLYQPYIVNFSAYEPMYFLAGTDPAKSKFQISFKYRLFNSNGSLLKSFSELSGVHFSYTQTSFWNLASSSAPFEDTSYKPELFYISDNWLGRPKWMQGFFVQSGVRHESNGRAEEFSRSTNIIYIKPSFILYDGASRLGLQLSPKLLGYFNNDEKTNSDLADYRGNVALEIKFGEADGVVCTTKLRFAERGTSVQADLSYPLSHLLRNNFDFYFHVQYSNAYAESLINYKEHDESVRIGFSMVR